VCVWSVGAEVFEVDIHRVSIEPSPNCSRDRVQLFDGDAQVPLSEPICGDEPPLETFTSRSSIFIVRFQSDQGGADAGFVLGYAVVEDESGQVDVDYNPAASGQRQGTQSVDVYFALHLLSIAFYLNLQHTDQAQKFGETVSFEEWERERERELY